ncbi:MAG TPA: hypothetical protein VJ878_00580 [Candidatus Izemoplasmatales bacterium]|nr:hypothetical protein [Candidatus Izemoplasmatales bacterium]
MILFTNIANWFKYNIWWLFIIAILILFVIIFIRLKNKPKKIIRSGISDESINEYIKAYGSVSNIISAELDGRRLKVSVKKIDDVDLENFKSLGATGIFITGNNIKMVFPNDMQKLVNRINDILDGGKK